MDRIRLDDIDLTQPTRPELKIKPTATGNFRVIELSTGMFQVQQEYVWIDMLKWSPISTYSTDTRAIQAYERVLTAWGSRVTKPTITKEAKND